MPPNYILNRSKESVKVTVKRRLPFACRKIEGAINEPRT